MALRRSLLMQGIQSQGSYIYRLDNAPTDAITDTGICVTDTDQDFSILCEVEYPTATYDESASQWKTSGHKVAVSTNNAMLMQSASLVFGVYANYARTYWMTKTNYGYNNNTRDFIRTSPRRYSMIHAKDSNTSVSRYNNFTLTTPTGAFTSDSNHLFINKSSNAYTVKQVLIYNKVLTDNEINNYITNGVIP